MLLSSIYPHNPQGLINQVISGDLIPKVIKEIKWKNEKNLLTGNLNGHKMRPKRKVNIH
jgi:hypothetical protein